MNEITQALSGERVSRDTEDVAEVLAQIDILSDQLLVKDPKMPYLMRDIHRALSKKAGIVTLLTDGEINTVFKGLESMKDTALSAMVTTKKRAAKRVLPSVGDL